MNRIVNDIGMYFLGTTQELRPYTGSKAIQWCARLEGAFVGLDFMADGLFPNYLVAAALVDMTIRVANAGVYNIFDKKRAKEVIEKSGLDYWNQNNDRRIYRNEDIAPGLIGFLRQGGKYVPPPLSLEKRLMSSERSPN